MRMRPRRVKRICGVEAGGEVRLEVVGFGLEKGGLRVCLRFAAASRTRARGSIATRRDAPSPWPQSSAPGGGRPRSPWGPGVDRWEGDGGSAARRFRRTALGHREVDKTHSGVGAVKSAPRTHRDAKTLSVRDVAAEAKGGGGHGEGSHGFSASNDGVDAQKNGARVASLTGKGPLFATWLSLHHLRPRK